MGVNEKRKFSMEILVILFIMNTILFRATSMEVSNTTYHCNGSVHECRVVEPETKRMLEVGSNNYPSIDAVLTSTKPAVVFDRSGDSYDSCLPGKKSSSQTRTLQYIQTHWVLTVTFHLLTVPPALVPLFLFLIIICIGEW